VDGERDRLAEPSRDPFDGQHDERHGERQQQREGDDVARGRAAGGKELGVASEHVEQRLCDRQRPEHGYMEPPLE
jgi:hypothetical protein